MDRFMTRFFFKLILLLILIALSPLSQYYSNAQQMGKYFIVIIPMALCFTLILADETFIQDKK